MTGQAVGVLDVIGDVPRREIADRAGVGFEHNPRTRDMARDPTSRTGSSG